MNLNFITGPSTSVPGYACGISSLIKKGVLMYMPISVRDTTHELGDIVIAQFAVRIDAELFVDAKINMEQRDRDEFVIESD